MISCCITINIVRENEKKPSSAKVKIDKYRIDITYIEKYIKTYVVFFFFLNEKSERGCNVQNINQGMCKVHCIKNKCNVGR